MWMIGGYGDEVLIRGAFELFGRHCQAVGFPKHERMPDVAEALMREWLEQIEASTKQKRGKDMAAAGRPTTDPILARNRRQMRTKGPAIEIIALMVF